MGTNCVGVLRKSFSTHRKVGEKEYNIQTPTDTDNSTAQSNVLPQRHLLDYNF